MTAFSPLTNAASKLYSIGLLFKKRRQGQGGRETASLQPLIYLTKGS